MAEEAKTKPKVEKAPEKEKPEAAVAEVEEKPEAKTITIRGNEYPLPDKQPAELLFAARAASRAQRTQNEQGAMEAMLDMAAAYLGEEPLRHLMIGISVEEGVELVQDILEKASAAYGTDTGES
jgi:hypothetical protein